MSRLLQLFNYLIRIVGWQRWVIAAVTGLIAFTLCLVVNRRNHVARYKAIAVGLLATYVTALLLTTVIMRSTNAERPSIDLDVIGAIVCKLKYGYTSGYEILLNVVIFVPVGLLLPVATGWRLLGTMTLSMLLTIGIEASQFLLSKGWFELADILENVVGALIGYLIYAFVRVAVYRIRGSSSFGKGH